MPMSFLKLSYLFILHLNLVNSLPYFEGRNKINVCTTEWTQMVTCTDFVTKEDLDPVNWSGYEIDLFRKVMPILGWKNSDINWHCLGWDEILEALRTGNKTCDFAVAGLDINTEDLDAGLKYTWPTYRNGLRIAVSGDKKSTGLFAFMDAFSPGVWAVTILTCMFVGFSAWALDYFILARNKKIQSVSISKRRWLRYSHPEDEFLKGPSSYFWQSMSAPMSLTDFEGRYSAVNLIIVIYGFMLLVLVTLYTANTTANITATRLRSNIRSLADLPDKRVVTWTDYVGQLRRYSINAYGFPWDTDEDQENFFDWVKAGVYDALLLDASVLGAIAAADCNIELVGSLFDSFDQAVAFPKGFSNVAFINRYNEILQMLREGGEVTALENTYLSPPEASCKKASQSSTQITLSQVAGLWIVLGSGYAVCLLFIIVREAHYKYAKAKLDRVTTTVLKKASGTMKWTGKQMSSFGSGKSSTYNAPTSGAEEDGLPNEGENDPSI